jgi:hypothetical protein
MSDKVLPYALTTTQRIKDRLGITTNSPDVVLTRLINGVTDFIESYCERHFVKEAYSNQLHIVREESQRYLLLQHSPVLQINYFEWRAGTISNPSWEEFMTDQYELEGDGSSGVIRVYGGMPRGTNMVRVSYVAGYLVDWENVGDLSKHNLPADLTDLAERLVIKMYNRREKTGIKNESFNNANVFWNDAIEIEDKMTLNRYARELLI